MAKKVSRSRILLFAQPPLEPSKDEDDIWNFPDCRIAKSESSDSPKSLQRHCKPIICNDQNIPPLNTKPKHVIIHSKVASTTRDDKSQNIGYVRGSSKKVKVTSLLSNTQY